MFPRSLQISWLLAAITVHSHPQSLFPGSDNSAMFDRLRLDKFFDILNPSTGLENSEDLSRTPYIANSYFDDSAPTAAPKVATPPDDLGIDPVSQGSGTDLAYNSLQNASGGSGVSPILPWSLSPIDQSSATTSDSDAPDANISLAPETKDFGVGGGAGSGGGGGGELPPVFFIPLAAPQGPILSPGTTSRPAGVPYWERHGPHEEDSDKPDCPHFPGNLRVLFCCPRTSDSKIPPIAKNPTRQANCFLFDKDNPACFDPRNRFCAYCLTWNNVAMDAVSLYFLPGDGQKPVADPPAAYTLGPPILTSSYPGFSGEPGREIWLGENVVPGRICSKYYLKAHSIYPNNRSRPPRSGGSNRRIK